MFLSDKSIAYVLMVLKMKEQNAAMTCILYNDIYPKNIYFSFLWQKSQFQVKVQQLIVHIQPLQMTEERHYMLTYMVQGQYKLQNNEYKYLNLSGQAGLHHHVVWD